MAKSMRLWSLQLSAINAYLRAVHEEAALRGFRFNRANLACAPRLHREHRAVAVPQAHPLFDPCPGPRARWERA